MAMNTRLSVNSIICMGMLLLMFYVTDTECNALRNKYDIDELLTKSSDDDVSEPREPQSYPSYFRQALMDAGHVIDNMIRKGSIKLTEIPYQGWTM